MRRLGWVSVLVASAASGQALGAAIPAPLAILADRAELVVVGRVAAIDLAAGSLPTPETRIDVTVEATLKGGEQSLVTVYQPGGSTGSVTGVVAGTPKYVPGERVLLFLGRARGQRLRVLGLFEGKFSIERGASGEEQAVRRAPGSERVLDTVPLDQVIRIVRERS